MADNLQPGLLLCPTCGQRLPGSQRRVCGLCQRPILRHEKYCYEGSMVRHRDCADPREPAESGRLAEWKDRVFGERKGEGKTE